MLKMYSNESKGERFPPVMGLSLYYSDGVTGPLASNCNSQDEPEFAPKVDAIYPEYITDWKVFQCPSNPDVGDGVESHLSIIAEGCPYAGLSDDPDDSYIYLGWVVDKANSDDPTTPGPNFGEPVPLQLLLALAILQANDAVTESLLSAVDGNAARQTLDSDLNVGQPFGNGNGDTVYRLREGIERFLITDINNPAASAQAQSETAIYWDSINLDPTAGASYNHVPGGGNVLFLDGHVQFFKYTPGGDGEFPINGGFARTVYEVAP